jgi:hypothetical protein
MSLDLGEFGLGESGGVDKRKAEENYLMGLDGMPYELTYTLFLSSSSFHPDPLILSSLSLSHSLTLTTQLLHSSRSSMHFCMRVCTLPLPSTWLSRPFVACLYSILVLI